MSTEKFSQKPSNEDSRRYIQGEISEMEKLPILEKITGLKNHERKHDYVSNTDALRDFSIICAEGGSVAGGALEQAFSNITEVENKEELIKILDEVRVVLDEYDATDDFGRVADFYYKVTGESVDIVYETSSSTKISCNIDFEGGAKVTLSGNPSSVVRRSCAVKDPNKFKTDMGKEVLPNFVIETLDIIDKYNNLLREENMTGSMESPLKLKVFFEDSLLEGGDQQEIYISVDYHASYHRQYESIEGIRVGFNDDINDKVKSYFEKMLELSNKIKSQ